MTFEEFSEQFPTLEKALMEEQETGEGGWVETHTETIQRCCLDKQSVREVLLKWIDRSEKSNAPPPFTSILLEIQRELGL